jgi:hypothetical protein
MEAASPAFSGGNAADSLTPLSNNVLRNQNAVQRGHAQICFVFIQNHITHY